MMIRRVHADTTPNMVKVNEILEGLKKNPKDGELWYALGCEYSQSKFEESCDAFAMAIGMDPFNMEYYFNRGRKHLSTEKFAEALADFHMALRLDPEDGQIEHYLGVALYYLGIYEEAAKYFKLALAKNQKTGSDCIWPEVDWMWMAYVRAGKMEEAAEALTLVDNDHYSSEGDLAYKKRVRLYKGVDDYDTFMKNVDYVDRLNTVTELYGAANYFMFVKPDKALATKMLDEALAITEYKNAFGWKCANFDRMNGIA